MVFVRQLYNYDVDEASRDSGLVSGISLTKQSFRDEVDINNIITRFGLGAPLPVGARMPTYSDYSNLGDYHQALNAIALANESFDAMPANVRARFNNDPGQFVDFCNDSNNRDEAVKLGLIAPAVVDLVSRGATEAQVEPVVTAPVDKK